MPAGVAPTLVPDGRLEFRGARHPLLIERLRAQSGGQVVASDLLVLPPHRALVISGPNTGGKTVALKAFGLLAALMIGWRLRVSGARGPGGVLHVAAALLFVAACWQWGLTPLLVQRLVLACGLLVLFFIDLDHHWLPDAITLPGIGLGLIASLGAWLAYGLGCEASDLPAFVAMTSSDKGKTCGQLFYDYYWGSGFLPSRFQGVRFRNTGDPVPYLQNPPGTSREQRRALLDDLQAMNAAHLTDYGDPEIDTRIAQYEMAFKMQASVPDLLDFSKEPKSVIERYGPNALTKGTFANNCLIARRLLERGVRFVQLMHSGWDQHGNLYTQLEEQCRDTDAPAAAATGR